MNDGKGDFTRKDLPGELQLAPIFSFTSFPGAHAGTHMASGNFYGVLPYEGQYDAMNPTVFNYNKKSGQFIPLSQLPLIRGECRDAKWINYAGDKKILVLARNNNQLTFLKTIP